MHRLLLQALADGLTAAGFPARLSEDCVRLKNWPTIVVRLRDIHEQEHDRGLRLIHAQIDFALNATMPDSILATCSTGWGEGKERPSRAARSRGYLVGRPRYSRCSNRPQYSMLSGFHAEIRVASRGGMRSRDLT